MASNINPNNIDTAYPIAGQDNDSQGFRDNFTNIQTNFQAAATEITDLQGKAVLKAALTGTTLDNDMGGSLLIDAQLQDIAETKVDLGSISGSQTVNYATGSFFTLTTTGSVNLSFTNWPSAGLYGRCKILITVASTAHTLTLTATSGWLNAIGIIGAATSGTTTVITFPATGTYEFEVETITGGSTLILNEVNKRLLPFNNSSEDLADGATANVAVTLSYFTTGAAETATLPSAPVGCIKVFYARDVTSGNMVITASGAAWGGAGTITFANTGDACTLLSTGGAWVCIGNNGCTFA